MSEPNEIDILMARIESINHKTVDDLEPSDITDIILYHRQLRSRRERGERPTRTKVDVSNLLEGFIARRAAPSLPSGFKKRI